MPQINKTRCLTQANETPHWQNEEIGFYFMVGDDEANSRDATTGARYCPWRNAMKILRFSFHIKWERGQIDKGLSDRDA